MSAQNRKTPLNVEKGKQGFQPTEKDSAATDAGLTTGSAVGDGTYDWAADPNHVWTDAELDQLGTTMDAYLQNEGVPHLLDRGVRATYNYKGRELPVVILSGSERGGYTGADFLVRDIDGDEFYAPKETLGYWDIPNGGETAEALDAAFRYDTPEPITTRFDEAVREIRENGEADAITKNGQIIDIQTQELGRLYPTGKNFTPTQVRQQATSVMYDLGYDWDALTPPKREAALNHMHWHFGQDHD